jgi:integrase
MSTTLFVFDKKLFDYVVEWVKLLKSKGYSSQAPLFPRAKADKGKDALSFETASEVEPEFWQGTGRIREIFKKRSQEAELPYFPPHTFRHLAVHLAFKSCKNGEEMKAISQNFGHEHIATTLSSYANYHPQRIADIIKNMDFSGKPKETLVDQVKELIKKIEKRDNACRD